MKTITLIVEEEFESWTDNRKNRVIIFTDRYFSLSFNDVDFEEFYQNIRKTRKKLKELKN